MSGLAYAGPSGGTGIRWQAAAVSEDAATIRRRLGEALRHILRTASTGAAYATSDRNLTELEEEAYIDDWDGKGTRAVDVLSIAASRRFLTLLPTSFPPPYIAADPDGEVSFDWEGRPGWLFSVSFAADQSIAYAGIFGPARVRGIEWFSDEIPAAILEGLRRTLGGR